MCRPLALALLLAAIAVGQGKSDAATAAWWAQTTALSNDSMEGRDTGTEAYERAAKYVAGQFAAAGLKPAGDSGTFFQRVPMHQTGLDVAHSSVEIRYFDPAQKAVALRLLEEITLVPRQRQIFDMSGGMAFLGYGAPLPGPNQILREARTSVWPSSSTTFPRVLRRRMSRPSSSTATGCLPTVVSVSSCHR